MIQIEPLTSDVSDKSNGRWIGMLRQGIVLLLGAVLMAFGLSGIGLANVRPPEAGRGPLGKPTVTPNKQLRVHRVSNMYFSITNYGKLGSESGDISDPFTGLPAPSCEFPAGSNLEYLFQGAIWIGAVVETDPIQQPGVLDTLVSIGNDGWWGDYMEMFPEVPPKGEVMMLSTRGPNAPPYADSVGTLSKDLPGREFRAISEQDFLCVYTDTILQGVVPDQWDGRPHRPLGLRILQKSYSWSYEYAEDFVLVDFEIENTGPRELDGVYMAIYIDADVWHTSREEYPEAQDDVCGFLERFYPNPADSALFTRIFTAWIADADGDPTDGAYDYRSPQGLSGCRVVSWPGRNVDVCNPDYNPDTLTYSFNWWISNVQSPFDWGPQLALNYAKWGIFPGGGKGTPGGDKAKYQVMSNGEFDYGQIWSAINQPGWIPNTTQTPSDIADGFDTRYLYSFGRFDDIAPGRVDTLTVAYVAGEDLHVDPNNYNDNLFNSTGDSGSIAQYYSKLDFQDFATNAQWAGWVYDNPNYDTDGDGCPGRYDIVGADTFWYMGDGVPDFKGPPPPFAPRLDTEISKGHVVLKWQSVDPQSPGTSPEDGEDSFSKVIDFEGYAAYMSYDGHDWILLDRFDRIDWLPLTYDTLALAHEWVLNKAKQMPITTDSVMVLHNADPDHVTDTTFVPESLRDSSGTVTYWTSYDHNLGFGGILVDSVRMEGVEGDSIWVKNYSYAVGGLSKSRGVYFAVTSFDFGNPRTELSSLESAQAINSVLTYPIEKSDPIMVYPNPYNTKNTQDYIDKGYEDPNRAGWAEQDRRIWFSNFPDNQKAIIRIWTLDGDLVRAVTYDPSGFIGNPSGIVYWDLVTRNGQAIVSGVYIYTIEFISLEEGVSDRESEIGKFVIIK